MEAAGTLDVAAALVSNICGTGRLTTGETVLIRGATGGIGVFGIQLIKTLGGRVAVTASTAARLEAARGLGADILINYVDEDFATRMTDERGADITRYRWRAYLEGNVQALAPFGRMVTIGMQGSAEGTLNFAALMKKKASVSGALLRDRSTEQKTQIMAEVKRIVRRFYGPARSLPSRTGASLSDASSAHAYFETKGHVGKLVLDCRNIS